MAAINIDLQLLTRQELDELKALCLDRLKKNLFITQSTVGGKSFSSQEVVPTADLLSAISAEIRRRTGERITRTVPGFV